ncbi:MFS transporter [Metabacillus niabensis]|uniref:Fucose permease n=1 Tax=Metabacillus niabensis TaxID=324854 RepID=A0ABT9Z2V3_9BACI|nr:MFS transporter [Metabacillus niabensis]MDQ0226591.1 fucose permease [Metabacillus niabensis]
MATLLLVIIYLAFISLGLPDSLLGSAWPVMQSDFGKSLDTAGYLYMIISAGTILSSLVSGRLNDLLGTGKVMVISVLLTAGALLGFSFAPSFIWLVICAIPLGLGGGAVDAALNNYVALHYKASHMSWLHCFWGVGASIGPIIMSFYISHQGSWEKGYFTISMLQIGLTIILFLSLPLWAKVAKMTGNTAAVSETATSIEENPKAAKPLKIKGVKFALLTFLFYCGVEATMGLWGSSYLVNSKGMSAAVAAQWVSLFYAGITIGRLVTGFITMKVNNTLLIRIGQFIIIFGGILLVLPLPNIVSLLGFIAIGLGCAPIYPCMIHETPSRFGRANSQAIIGYQMAVAYVGSTFLPPLFGLIANYISIHLFSFVILVLALCMLFAAEKVNGVMKLRA